MNKNSLNETINKINRIDISINKKLNESETKKCLTKKRIALIKKNNIHFKYSTFICKYSSINNLYSKE